MKNNNKVVLVTGSSSGIGEGIATLFAKNGYKVVLNCKSSVESMETLKNKLLEINPDILAFQCDVSVYSEAEKMFSSIKESFGEVDILVNNAGVSEFGLFTDVKPENLNNTISTNLNSCMNCTHLALPNMIRNQSGTVINISSIWGNVGASCEVLYSTSKSAINGFTKSIAKEVAPSNVLINSIACGLIDTRMNSNLSLGDIDAFVEEIPLSRQGTPREVAEMCLFLAEKNTYMTGQVLTLDGGYL